MKLIFSLLVFGMSVFVTSISAAASFSDGNNPGTNPMAETSTAAIGNFSLSPSGEKSCGCKDIQLYDKLPYFSQTGVPLDETLGKGQ